MSVRCHQFQNSKAPRPLDQSRWNLAGTYILRHDFKFLGSYEPADGDCTKEIKRRIALARQKAVVLASIWKDRNIKTATKVKVVMKSMVWAVLKYGVEGWTLKKSDRNRIEAFEMWCWSKTVCISWQEHHTNDSVLTELDLERVAKLKLQYFGHILGEVQDSWHLQS